MDSQQSRLTTVLVETMDYLGMKEHSERFLRLLAQADITSLEDVEKLDEYDCSLLHLPWDLVETLQKRSRIWRLELQDHAEVDLARGEAFYTKQGMQTDPFMSAQNGKGFPFQTPSAKQRQGAASAMARAAEKMRLGHVLPKAGLPSPFKSPKSPSSAADASELSRVWQEKQRISDPMRTSEVGERGTERGRNICLRIEDVETQLSRVIQQMHMMERQLHEVRNAEFERGKHVQQELQRLRDFQLNQQTMLERQEKRYEVMDTKNLDSERGTFSKAELQRLCEIQFNQQTMIERQGKLYEMLEDRFNTFCEQQSQLQQQINKIAHQAPVRRSITDMNAITTDGASQRIEHKIGSIHSRLEELVSKNEVSSSPTQAFRCAFLDGIKDMSGSKLDQPLSYGAKESCWDVKPPAACAVKARPYSASGRYGAGRMHS